MTTPVLDPEFAHLSGLDVGFGGPAVDLAEMRASLEKLIQPPPPITGVSRRTVVIGESELSVEMFVPDQDGPCPCLIWLHGGGFMIGSAMMDAARLQDWSKRFGCIALSVDYRLAPEHPFPAALNDSRQALRWVRDRADELSIDPERIVVGGASAGGGLAAALALSARDEGLGLAGQLLIYPMIDDRQHTTSSRWDASVWPPQANELGWRAYLGDLYGGTVPPVAAPSRAMELNGLPPTIMIVGGADGFFDEDIDYATRLTHAGVPTDLRVYAGAPHGFDLMAPEAGASLAMLREAEAWFEEHAAIRT